MATDEIMIGVGAVIRNAEGKVLLVRHVPEKGGFWHGKWICPGGKLCPGERIVEGIKREVREETHLDIRLTTPLIPFETVVKSDEGLELHIIYIDYLAEEVSGELQPDDDVGEALWVSVDDIKRMWDDLHQDTRRLLKIAEVV